MIPMYDWFARIRYFSENAGVYVRASLSGEVEELNAKLFTRDAGRGHIWCQLQNSAPAQTRPAFPRSTPSRCNIRLCRLYWTRSPTKSNRLPWRCSHMCEMIESGSL